MKAECSTDRLGFQPLGRREIRAGSAGGTITFDTGALTDRFLQRRQLPVICHPIDGGRRSPPRVPVRSSFSEFRKTYGVGHILLNASRWGFAALVASGRATDWLGGICARWR